ncbi:MAG: O-antigen ligase family protein [Verrucomicrobiales bacterium]|nr:O-antigen ligase family protein [Verrucomicrobiales bacterium]
MFRKPVFTNLLLGLSLVAWLVTAFASSTQLLTLWPGVLLFGVAAALAACTLARGFHGRANRACLVIALAFAAWILTRGTMSDVKWLARQDMVICLGAWFAYVLVAAVFESAAQRRWISVGWLVLLGVNLLAATRQLAAGNDFLPHGMVAGMFPKLGVWLGWDGMAREPLGNEVAGFFRSENHFSGLVEMLGLFSLAWALLGNLGRVGRVVCFVLFFASAAGIILSTSRGAYVAFCFGAVVLCLFWFLIARKAGTSGRAALRLGGAVLVLLLGAVAAVGMLALRHEYAKGGVVSKDHLTQRMAFTKLGWEQFLSQPVTGTGARSYEYEERSRRSLATEHWTWYGPEDSDAIFAHNDWVQLLADYGIIGGVLGAALLVSHFSSGAAFLWRRARQRQERRIKGGDDRLAWTVGALAALSAMAVHSVIDFNLHIAVNAIVAAGLLALLANPGREQLVTPEAGGEELIPRHGVLLRPVLFVAAVAGAGFVWVYGPDWFRGEVALRHAEQFREQDQYYEAVQDLQKAVDCDSQNYSAYMVWGHLNEDETARIDSMPPPTSQLQQQLREQVREGHLRSAFGQYEKAWLLYTQNPYAAMGAANCASQLRDFASAETWFGRAFAYGKASRRLAMHYGEHLIRKAAASSDLRTRLDFYERALDWFKRAEEKMRLKHFVRDYLIRQIVGLTKAIEELKGKLAAPPAATTTPPPAPAPPPPAGTTAPPPGP